MPGITKAFQETGADLTLYLFTDTEFGDNLLISFKILLFQVIEHFSPLAHKPDQTSAGMMILLMRFKVFRQVGDPVA
jgi:hypothetical protein